MFLTRAQRIAFLVLSGWHVLPIALLLVLMSSGFTPATLPWPAIAILAFWAGLLFYLLVVHAQPSARRPS